MQCKIKIVYQNKEVFLESNVNIDFRFLRDQFGIELSKDRTRNPLILAIQIRNDSEIWILKNSFTTSVNVKFTERDVYKSLLVSDSFMLEERAFLKIEKFELLFENYSRQNGFNVQNTLSNQDSSFLTSHSAFPAQNTSQLNNMSNLITPPPKQSVVKFSDDENEEDSQSLWDYVDDLLKAESQSSFKQTPGQQAFVFYEPLNSSTRESSIPQQALESRFLLPKETPRKENLMLTGGKTNYCVLDLEEEDEIEALLAQTRQQSNGISQENNMMVRPSSPMVIEQQRPVINILSPEVEIPHENIDQNISQLPRMTMISESPNQMRMESTRIEIEEHKTPPPEPMARTQHFSQRASLTQSQNLMPYKSLSQHSSQRKSDVHQQSQFMSPAVSKMKQLQQLIEDKRGETASAKNSAVKSSPRETRDCSICLCDIDEGGKIDSCTHQFCFTCIQDWAKITNQCPLCKGRFNIIEKFSSDGTLLDTVPVVFKQQVYEDEGVFDDMDENCYECENGDDDAHLLVCDHCGFFCCHTYCCVPAFETVPIEDWYCKFCLPAIRRAQRRGGNANTNSNSNSTTSRRNRRSNQAAAAGTTGGTGSRRNSRRTNTVRQSSLDNFIVEDQPRNRNSNRTTTQIEEEPSRTNTRSNRNRRNTSNRTVITIIEDDEDVPIAPRNMSRNQRRLVV